MSVLKIDNQNFKKEVEEYTGLQLLEFYGEYCIPCKELEYILNEIDLELKTIKISKISLEESMELALKFNITSIPTLVFLKENKLLKKVTGNILQNKSKIIQLINSFKEI